MVVFVGRRFLDVLSCWIHVFLAEDANISLLNLPFLKVDLIVVAIHPARILQIS